MSTFDPRQKHEFKKSCPPLEWDPGAHPMPMPDCGPQSKLEDIQRQIKREKEDRERARLLQEAAEDAPARELREKKAQLEAARQSFADCQRAILELEAQISDAEKFPPPPEQ